MAYNKQRNYCTNLLRKCKKDYYSNISTSCVRDTKRFWKTIKPLFSEKKLVTCPITLVEENCIEDEPNKIAEIFNEFFINIVHNLQIAKINWRNENVEICDDIDPIYRDIQI